MLSDCRARVKGANQQPAASRGEGHAARERPVTHHTLGGLPPTRRLAGAATTADALDELAAANLKLCR
jgi:hypothetical protein